MFKVVINNSVVELFPKQSFNFVKYSPIFVGNKLKGDNSYPISFPNSDINKAIFKFMTDTRVSKRISAYSCIVFDNNIPVIKGIFNVKSFENNRIIGDITSGFGILFDKFNTPLNEMDFGGDLFISNNITENLYAYHADQMLYHSQFYYPDYPFTFMTVKNEGFNEGATIDQGYSTRTRLKGFMGHFIPFTGQMSNGQFDGFMHHQPNIANTMAVFLTILVKRIFTNYGFNVKGSFFEDADMRKIVLLSLNNQNYGLDIAKALPNTPAIELINAIIIKFNLGADYNPFTNTFTFDYNKDVFNYTSTDDWTEKVTPKYEVLPESTNGFTIKDNIDSADKYASSYIDQDWDNVNLKGSVTTFNNLPYTNVEIADVWFVEDEDAWYVATENQYMTTGSWKLFQHNYFPVVVGDGELNIEANISTAPNRKFLISTTWDWNSPSATPDKTISCPVIDQKGNNPVFLDNVGHPASGNMFGFRIFIWHGIVDSPDDAGYKYVHASASNKLPNGNQNTYFSLYTNGEKGTYKVFWEKFLNLIGNPLIVKRSVWLTPMEYQALDMKVPKKINGELFFVKSIKTKLPINGASTVELVKIKPKINETNPGTA
jgi:hypothetical protein